MIRILQARLHQRHRTMAFPRTEAPPLPDRYRGRPSIDASKCPDGCRVCADACPTQAITINGKPSLDLGKCLFCTDCTHACPEDAIRYTRDYRLAVTRREDLVLSDGDLRLAQGMGDELFRILGRSLKLRQVAAGGCNGCESDVNVLNTVGWDLSRFGIQFVASPRHADGLLVTGTVPENMRLALLKTYEAVPAPKVVIAVGACAISGGPYIGHAEVHGGPGTFLPVDLYIPGCPPHPLTILDGMLRFMRKRVPEPKQA